MLVFISSSTLIFTGLSVDDFASSLMNPLGPVRADPGSWEACAQNGTDSNWCGQDG